MKPWNSESSDFANSNLVKWNVFIAFNGKLPPVKFQFNAFIALTKESKVFFLQHEQTYFCFFMHLLILSILIEMNHKTKRKLISMMIFHTNENISCFFFCFSFIYICFFVCPNLNKQFSIIFIFIFFLQIFWCFIILSATSFKLI